MIQYDLRAKQSPNELKLASKVRYKRNVWRSCWEL